MSKEPPEPDDDAAETSVHVRRAMRGDGTSLDWLVARLSPLLLAQARYRLGAALRRDDEPEDLVQEAWMVVLPKLADLTARNERYTPVLLSMLSTTLLYRINNLVRKHARRGAVAEPQEVALDKVEGQASGVVSRALRRERADRVTKALNALDAKDREVIILCGIEQLPARAAAAILQLEPDAVRMRYRRALGRLRHQLGESVFDELEE